MRTAKIGPDLRLYVVVVDVLFFVFFFSLC